MADVKKHDVRAIREFVEFYSEYLNDLDELRTITQEELLTRISKKHGVSVRTLKRHLSSFRSVAAETSRHGIEGLVSKAGSGYVHRRDNKVIEICHPRDPGWVLDVIHVRINAQYVPIIKYVIEKECLTTKRISKKHAYDSIVAKCIASDLEPPKPITIYKLLDRIDPQIWERMRNPKKAAVTYDQVTRGFSNQEALFPLHIVEIDHTQLDLDVIDPTHGFTLGRPWITLGIDVYSRMVWCMYISFEPPSRNRVRKAIEHGIFFKNTRDRYGTHNEWECFGIPQIIQMDNGSEFRSPDIRHLIDETLQSHVRYRPITTPRWGGAIERLFGTINTEIVHRMDGTRKSSVHDLGEYDPEAEAIYTLDDVIRFLTKYIVDIYHQRPHRGLPPESPSPILRYRQGLALAGVPEIIPPEFEQSYRIQLLPSVEKPYTREGIRMDSVSYRSNDCAHLVGKREVKYKVKYDPDDISRVFIYPPNSNEYIEVPAVSPGAHEIAGVNRFTYKLIRKRLQEQGLLDAKGIPGTQDVAKAKAELAEEMAKTAKQNRKMKRRNQRITGLDYPMKAPNATKQEPSEEDLIAYAMMKAEQRGVEK
ncbi:MAG: DDE-type integrase/transposase/recombinase [Alicyclobacillus sp.]|nr:DDE-type integrase/transposase/recombinase [Alicyclobacillus sp.]